MNGGPLFHGMDWTRPRTILQNTRANFTSHMPGYPMHDSCTDCVHTVKILMEQTIFLSRLLIGKYSTHAVGATIMHEMRPVE